VSFHENYDSNGGFGKRAGKSLFYGDIGLRIAIAESLSVTIPRFGVGGGWNDANRPKNGVLSIGLAWSF
jgi:hypothetical protein